MDCADVRLMPRNDDLIRLGVVLETLYLEILSKRNKLVELVDGDGALTAVDKVQHPDNILLGSSPEIEDGSSILISLENSTKELRGGGENDPVGGDGDLVLATRVVAQQRDVSEGLVGEHVLDLRRPLLVEVIPGQDCIPQRVLHLHTSEVKLVLTVQLFDFDFD